MHFHYYICAKCLFKTFGILFGLSIHAVYVIFSKYINYNYFKEHCIFLVKLLLYVNFFIFFHSFTVFESLDRFFHFFYQITKIKHLELWLKNIYILIGLPIFIFLNNLWCVASYWTSIGYYNMLTNIFLNIFLFFSYNNNFNFL